MKKSEKIEQLEKEIKELRTRLELLEMKEKGKSIWDEIDPVKKVIPPIYEHDYCSVCHMKYASMTHYVCPRLDCPSKVTYSTNQPTIE